MHFHKLTTILWLLLFAALPVHAANIYKYYDDEGREILGSQVPAEYVKNGYEVINERGQVIQVVPRTLTDEERAAQADTLNQEQLAEEARRQQEEDDRLLLRLYRTPEEVVRRRDSTIEELDVQVSVLSALLLSAEEKFQDLQARVDSAESAGNEVDESLQRQYDSALEERDRLARQVARIENEKVTTIETAEKNIARLKELLNLE